MARIPVVSVYHNNVDQDGYVRSLFDRLTLFLTAHNVAVSEQVAQSITERSWLPAKRISVITNGIEFAHVTVPYRSKKDLGISDDCFVIGAVGRLVAVKRFDYLIDTYATCGIASSSLVIIGSGPLEKALRNQVERLHLDARVHFLTDHEALSYYQLFDCFVQTSEKEGVSLALLEAMSFCKAGVVMGNNGYHPIISHDYDGLIVDPSDQVELIEVFRSLYNNQARRVGLGLRAQDTVQKRFGLPHMVHEYQKLFDQLSL
jgi:glycosyltransferase involved in cell wall biosynthesis